MGVGVLEGEMIDIFLSLIILVPFALFIIEVSDEAEKIRKKRDRRFNKIYKYVLKQERRGHK